MMHQTVLIALFILLTSQIAWAAVDPGTPAPDSIQRKGSWIEDKQRGWYFYNEEPEPEKPVLQKKPELPPPPPPPPPPQEPLPDFTKKETHPVASPAPPEPFTAEWFRKNLPKYKDRAWNNPTPENIRTYFTLQKIVLDRAERFANVAKEVIVGDPLLDESTNRPLAVAASRSHDIAARKATEEILGEMKDKFGLVFIFSGTKCRGDCLLAARNVKKMENFGFKVLPVSADGANFPDNPYQEYTTDKKVTKRLGLVNYPALALIDLRTKEIIPVAQYAMALSQMKEIILLAAKKRGYIDENQWRKTKRYAPILHADQPEVLETLKQVAGKQADKDGFIPPEKLYPYIMNISPGITPRMLGAGK